MATKTEVSGLLDDLAALETARSQGGGVRCRVSVAYESVDESVRQALDHLIDGTQVFGSRIAATLRKHGVDIQGSQVQRHRRRSTGGGCLCPPPTETH